MVGLGSSKVVEEIAKNGEEPVRQVLRALAAHGGKVVDTWPRNPANDGRFGTVINEPDLRNRLFVTTKIDRVGKDAGIAQFREAQKLYGRKTIDLVQIFSLTDLDTHWPSLRAWKDAGEARYIGVTVSEPRLHADLEAFLRRERPDFTQVNYSITERASEERLLPLAADRGVAVLVNRPFMNGSYFKRLEGKPLPPWAAEAGCTTWAQFSLKYILANPAVTCVLDRDQQPAPHGRERADRVRRPARRRDPPADARLHRHGVKRRPARTRGRTALYNAPAPAYNPAMRRALIGGTGPARRHQPVRAGTGHQAQRADDADRRDRRDLLLQAEGRGRRHRRGACRLRQAVRAGEGRRARHPQRRRRAVPDLGHAWRSDKYAKLLPYVGQTVEITGTEVTLSNNYDVRSFDLQTIKAQRQVRGSRHEREAFGVAAVGSAVRVSRLSCTSAPRRRRAAHRPAAPAATAHHLHQARRADSAALLPDLPSPGHQRADVADDLRGRAAVGARDQGAR